MHPRRSVTDRSQLGDAGVEGFKSTHIYPCSVTPVIDVIEVTLSYLTSQSHIYLLYLLKIVRGVFNKVGYFNSYASHFSVLDGEGEHRLAKFRVRKSDVEAVAA